MAAKAQAAKAAQGSNQADCLRAYSARNAIPDARSGTSTVSVVMEDAVLFMVHYLQEVQGPRHVVGRDFTHIASTPEARRLFLSTTRHLLLQLIRSGDTYLSVTNFHDLLRLMCPDFQLRVVKSAFKAAWVVQRDRPRATQAQPKLPFEKFWKCLELTWLYEPYFLSMRRYVFDSNSHTIKLSAQVKEATREVEDYIQREGWPAIPNDIMKDAIGRASVMHGDVAACHFDGIVRMLCVNEPLRHHLKLENHATTLAARQAAIAAAAALAEKKRRSRLVREGGDPSALARTASFDRITSYGSFGGQSMDHALSMGSAGGDSPRSATSYDLKVASAPPLAPLPPAVTRSKESSTSGSSGGSKGSVKQTRGIAPAGDGRVPRSPADSVSEMSAGREADQLKISAADIVPGGKPPVAKMVGPAPLPAGNGLHITAAAAK